MVYHGVPDAVADSLPFEELLRNTFDSLVKRLKFLYRNWKFLSHHSLYVDRDTAKMLELLGRDADICCLLCGA